MIFAKGSCAPPVVSAAAGNIADEIRSPQKPLRHIRKIDPQNMERKQIRAILLLRLVIDIGNRCSRGHVARFGADDPEVAEFADLAHQCIFKENEKFAFELRRILGADVSGDEKLRLPRRFDLHRLAELHPLFIRLLRLGDVRHVFVVGHGVRRCRAVIVKRYTPGQQSRRKNSTASEQEFFQLHFTQSPLFFIYSSSAAAAFDAGTNFSFIVREAPGFRSRFRVMV